MQFKFAWELKFQTFCKILNRICTMSIHLTEYFVKPNMYCHSTTTTTTYLKLSLSWGSSGLGPHSLQQQKFHFQGRCKKRGRRSHGKLFGFSFFVCGGKHILRVKTLNWGWGVIKKNLFYRGRPHLNLSEKITVGVGSSLKESKIGGILQNKLL